MTEERSARIVENLVRAGKFPHSVRAIEVIETHISWVLLTGDFAYKIKKPVSLGFLDFSTPESRRHFCAEELRLNRRYAPEIYLEVVDIGGSIDAPVMGSKKGAVLEVAVRMMQFPSDALISQQLADGRVSTQDMETFGVTLARLHADAPVAEPGTRQASRAAVFAPVEDNFRVLRSKCQDAALISVLEKIHRSVVAESERLGPVFERRQRQGCVRECHGDLHLSNIVRLHDRITPFDCLEFDPALRWIDVMNEVAFLFMDTLRLKRADLAYAFLNGYLGECGDYAGLEVLPFYVSYRALVRAKVRVLGGLESAADDSAFHDYLELASQWVSRAENPALIITHGLSGSGKTVVSGKLMTALPAIRLRSDVERKRLFGYREHEQSLSDIAAGIYAAAAGEKTYERLMALAGIGLAAGFNVVVDAAFLEQSQRQRFRLLADEVGSDFVVLVCEAPVDELRERVGRRQRSGDDASEAGLAVLNSQLEHYQPLTEEDEARAVRVDSRNEMSGEDVAAMIGVKLRSAPGIRK
jgi:aminoglycoside phosphotransferase family enzyme/predicted kinase